MLDIEVLKFYSKPEVDFLNRKSTLIHTHITLFLELDGQAD